MNATDIAKKAASLVVGTAVGTVITKSLIANAPATEKFKIAEISGALGGWIFAEKFEPQTDKLVDNLIAARRRNRIKNTNK